MDRLLIEGLELWLRVGCTSAERSFPQRIMLDISCEMDLKDAGKIDDIKKTLDYALLCGNLRRVLGTRTYRLAEAVAETAAELTLKNKGVREVMVRVKKRALPGIDWAGVEIRRRLS